MRVVADTNLFVSALLSAIGAPADLLRGWRLGRFTLIVSEKLLAEIEEVLLRPRFSGRFSAEQVAGFVSALRISAHVHDDPEVTTPQTPDPSDDFLIALAESAGADALVTGDRELREAKGLPMPVLSPRELIELLDRMEP